ncbi:MAG: 2Fe-2S iron-sulfur cluster-binding protein, partial [Sphingobacteriia bacterium]
MKFVPLTVQALIHETEDAYTLQFENPDPATFAYKPGQYLTLKVTYQGESLRRAFSLSSCPDQDPHLSVTIKAVPNGRVSNYLRQHLKPGDTIEVFPPMGKFTLSPDAGQARHYVLIGGGSGITPLFSILQSVLLKEPQSQVTLLYANRNERSIIFGSRLAELERQSGGRLQVVHVLDKPLAAWDGPTGMLTRPLAMDLLGQIKAKSELPTEYYMCGPTPMMDAVLAALHRMGEDEANIHREYYTAPLPDEETAEEDSGEVDYELRDREVSIRLDGKTTRVAVPAGTNILDAAIGARLDPPYACQEGICSTCRAKVHSGLVQMVEREGLSDEEVEAGYVLTCQC